VRVSLTRGTVKIFKVILCVGSNQQIESLSSFETLTIMGKWNAVCPSWYFKFRLIKLVWHCILMILTVMIPPPPRKAFKFLCLCLDSK